MTLNITDAELHEWARMRADDAGRLARELVACRQQSQAAVAAAYEAAAQVCDSGNAGAFWGKAIRALATPDQIAALAAKVDASQAPNPAVNGGRCQSDTIPLPRAEVEALITKTSHGQCAEYSRVGHSLAEASWHVHFAGFASRGEAEACLAALAALQERMK